MRFRLVVLLLTLVACRSRGGADLETASGMATVTEPETAALSPADAAPDAEGWRRALTEPLIRDGQRVCPETHPFPHEAGYYNRITRCSGGGIAFCASFEPTPVQMPAAVHLIDPSNNCWLFINTPQVFPPTWQVAMGRDCWRDPDVPVRSCPSQ